MTATNTFNLYFDGGTLGQNGEVENGYGSWEVEFNGFRKRVERQVFLAVGVGHRVTNNVAEWMALKCAAMWLESVKDKRLYFVNIHSDSKLVLNQLDGTWKAKDQNMKELRDGVLHYLKEFGWGCEWRGRSESVERFGH